MLYTLVPGPMFLSSLPSAPLLAVCCQRRKQLSGKRGLFEGLSHSDTKKEKMTRTSLLVPRDLRGRAWP